MEAEENKETGWVLSIIGQPSQLLSRRANMRTWTYLSLSLLLLLCSCAGISRTLDGNERCEIVASGSNWIALKNDGVTRSQYTFRKRVLLHLTGNFELVDEAGAILPLISVPVPADAAELWFQSNGRLLYSANGRDWQPIGRIQTVASQVAGRRPASLSEDLFRALLSETSPDQDGVIVAARFRIARLKNGRFSLSCLPHTGPPVMRIFGSGTGQRIFDKWHSEEESPTQERR